MKVETTVVVILLRACGEYPVALLSPCSCRIPNPGCREKGGDVSDESRTTRTSPSSQTTNMISERRNYTP